MSLGKPISQALAVIIILLAKYCIFMTLDEIACFLCVEVDGR